MLASVEAKPPITSFVSLFKMLKLGFLLTQVRYLSLSLRELSSGILNLIRENISSDRLMQHAMSVKKQ